MANARTARAIMARAIENLRRSWRSLAATDLAYKAIAFALLSPATALLLRWIRTTGAGEVVADTDILWFFVTNPAGVATLVIGLSLIVAITGLEAACLMAIGVEAAQGRHLDARSALAFGASNAPEGARSHRAHRGARARGAAAVPARRWRRVLGAAARARHQLLPLAAPATVPGGGRPGGRDGHRGGVPAGADRRALGARAAPPSIRRGTSAAGARRERQALLRRPSVDRQGPVAVGPGALALSSVAATSLEIVGRGVATRLAGSLALLIVGLMALALVGAVIALAVGIVNFSLFALSIVGLYLEVGEPKRPLPVHRQPSERAAAALRTRSRRGGGGSRARGSRGRPARVPRRSRRPAGGGDRASRLVGGRSREHAGGLPAGRR